MFGFEKKDMANIKTGDLQGFRRAARVYLGYTEEEMTAIVRDGALFELVNAVPKKGGGHGKGI